MFDIGNENWHVIEIDDEEMALRSVQAAVAAEAAAAAI